MRLQEPRWSRFAKAAVGEMAPAPSKSRLERLRRQAGDVRRRLAAAHADQADSEVRHRADIRLVPAVAAAWATAAVAIALPGTMALGWALVLGGGMLGCAGGFRLWRGSNWRSGQQQPAARPGKHHKQDARSSTPDNRATMLLAVCCVVAVLFAVGLRAWSSATSPLQQAVAERGSFTLTLEVGSVPRLMDSGNGPPRVVLDASVVQATGKGRTFTGRMPIRVVAADAWSGLQVGDTVATAGTIAPAAPQEAVSGFLHPSTEPLSVTAAKGGTQAAVAAIRNAWHSAVQQVWAPHSRDTAGLLPGMVMGDRSGMDSSLSDAMKTVGLTHLTAVSGANCTLVLASLMLALRSLRTPRLAAVAVSGAGLLGFVLLVGPDPSVLRAAVMGAIGAIAILGGRPKRVGALLSVSILVLLLADPWLAVDYAFILSVLATLGLHLVGRRCVGWLSVLLPLWLAQAVAIPLAAQLFCAPVIVLLQARLTPYTIPANMLAAPVVALVTTVGTFGMVAAAAFPPVGVLCAAVSGAGAWWVAVVARSMSALPASSLPWPEGAQGVILMALLNTTVLAGLFALVERQRVASIVARLRGHLPESSRRRFGFVAMVAFASSATLWWTAAVLQL
ncbi:ComEC/Rec2 family competence protein [Specibacter sp. AOP5-B1-6]|uniref:ComEC/Rec2 family competence protein n=1 Tax=Specibacter sp. AOP5-B1-6 TaxID=3457653 RepID=UPI00402BA971